MDSHDGREFTIAQTDPLTPREAEVLLWTAEGKTAWEAGRIMGITEGTARIHLARVLDKLNASNKPHAVARGFCKDILARKLVMVLLSIAACFTPPHADAARLMRRPVARSARNVKAARRDSLAGFNGRF